MNPENNKENNALIVAAKAGDVAKVKELIEAGADVNAKDEDGKTALIDATFNHTCPTRVPKFLPREKRCSNGAV